jgi:hypothetical protein
MRSWTTLIVIVSIAAGTAALEGQTGTVVERELRRELERVGVALAAQRSEDDRQALRERIEQRYDVVPLTGGLALRPKNRSGDIRLIEVADGTVSLNGVVVTGRELRERVGADAEPILRLSYLPPAEQRTLFETTAARGTAPDTAPPVERDDPRSTTAAQDAPDPSRRRTGERIRIFGDVAVAQDEYVDGQVVAVFGSVQVDGEVRDQVVAVFGSVNLGPNAIVRGDIVSVGGRVRRTPTSQTHRAVTEVSLSDSDFRFHVSPWLDDWGPFVWFGSFGAVPRLVGSAIRGFLLLLLAGIALVVARRSVEASAQRVSDNPVKTTVVGLLAQIMILPVLILTAIVLAISIIGIPLLLLLPFVVLFLIVLAVIGFTGTAAAVGNYVRGRFALGAAAPFAAVAVGIVVILSPLLLGRLLAVGGWPATPFAFMLVGAGFAVELLAWASGFGAVLTNAFTRWQSHRAARSPVVQPPVVS